MHTSRSRALIGKLPVHDFMTYVVEIDIFTGREEIGNLHFILNIIFLCIFIEKKHVYSQNSFR